MDVYNVADFLKATEFLKSTNAKYIAIKETNKGLVVYRYFNSSGKIKKLGTIEWVNYIHDCENIKNRTIVLD